MRSSIYRKKSDLFWKKLKLCISLMSARKPKFYNSLFIFITPIFLLVLFNLLLFPPSLYVFHYHIHNNCPIITIIVFYSFSLCLSFSDYHWHVYYLVHVLSVYQYHCLLFSLTLSAIHSFSPFLAHSLSLFRSLTPSNSCSFTHSFTLSHSIVLLIFWLPFPSYSYYLTIMVTISL